MKDPLADGRCAGPEANRTSRRSFLAGCSASVLAAAPVPVIADPPFLGDNTARIASQPGREAYRVITDTDPGVDDALALMLAMRSPELKIEGITPVAGNVPLSLTLPNALRMVEIIGRTDIPVSAGASSPLVRVLVPAYYAHGDNGLAGVQLPKPHLRPAQEAAAELIRRIIRKYPGEVTIICIGPLTNIDTALRADREMSAMVKNIILMGGSLSGGNITPAAEFNMYVDPEAAHAVFHSGIPITMVGLNVTRKTLVREDQVKQLEDSSDRAGKTAARILRAAFRLWRAHGYEGPLAMPLHDPLTVGFAINPRLLTLRDYYVEIETTGAATAGETVAYPTAPVRASAPLEGAEPSRPSFSDRFRANAKVATDVDADEFLKLLVARLTSSPKIAAPTSLREPTAVDGG